MLSFGVILLQRLPKHFQKRKVRIDLSMPEALPNLWLKTMFDSELFGPLKEFSHRKDVLTGRLPGPPTNSFNHNRADQHCQG